MLCSLVRKSSAYIVAPEKRDVIRHPVALMLCDYLMEIRHLKEFSRGLKEKWIYFKGT